MSRSVKEWKGATDDSAPSTACKLRILERQSRCCNLTGHEFKPGDKIHFDHVKPLWLGGENRETNLQAILQEPHARKTAYEATDRAKINATTAKHLGVTRPKGTIAAPPKPERTSTKPSLLPRNLYRRMST